MYNPLFLNLNIETIICNTNSAIETSKIAISKNRSPLLSWSANSSIDTSKISTLQKKGPHLDVYGCKRETEKKC